jgi:hypothetical protein
MRLRQLTLSKARPEKKIRCQKIQFKKIKMFCGEVEHITLNFKYQKPHFTLNKYIDAGTIFQPASVLIDSRPQPKNEFLFLNVIDTIFDFTANIDGVDVRSECFKINMDIDFKYTIYFVNS